MTPIYTREKVRQAVARALLASPDAGRCAAEEAAAHELCIPVEAVRDACEALEV